MNIFQRLILTMGAIALIMVLYVYPVKYSAPASRLFYDPQSGQNISTLVRVDIGATSLRGIAVLGATAALWAIAGKKKTN